jgi:hypothetical protein
MTQTITITVESAGYWTARLGAAPYAKITKNGREIGFGKYQRGLNVAVFDQSNGDILNRQNFDLGSDAKAVGAFAGFIANLPQGRIVAIAVLGDAAGLGWSEPGAKAFSSIGSFWGLFLYYGASWAAVGVKNGGFASAREYLPLPPNRQQIAYSIRSFQLQQPTPTKGTLELIQKLDGDDRFGYAVALHAGTALIGAWATPGQRAANAGSAALFQLEEGNWQEQQKFQPSDLGRNDYFGNAVAMDGDFALVGAYFKDVADKPDAGSAYIFHKLKGGQWVEHQKLQPEDLQRGDEFGFSVACKGQVAFVGSPRADFGDKPDTGRVYVFHRISDRSLPHQKLQPPELERDDYFGFAVAMDSNGTALVGAPSTIEGSSGGCVYVFELEGDCWQQRQKLQPSDLKSGDCFGRAVAIDGGVALVGARWADASDKPDTGSAYIFELKNGSWREVQKLQPPDLGRDDRFGHAVALRGDLALVAANHADAPGKPNAGCVYVFRQEISGWRQIAKLQPPDLQRNDYFGQCLALDEGLVLVGTYAGKRVYVFGE